MSAEKMLSRPLRVCVTGAECTGKTTLAEALGRAFNAPVVHESVREYFAEKARRGDPSVYAADIVHVVDIQIATESQAPTDVPLVVFDTDVFTIEIWQTRYFGDRFVDLHKLADERQSRDARHIDLYLLCSPDMPFEHDGVRGSNEERLHMHEVFRERLVAEGRAFVEIGGSLEERCRLAIGAIDGLAEARGRSPLSHAEAR